MLVDYLRDPRVQVGVGLFLTTLLVDLLLRRIVRRTTHASAGPAHQLGWRDVLRAALGPISLLVWYYGIYGVAWAVATMWKEADPWLSPGLAHARNIGAIVALFWFFFRLAGFLDQRLQADAAKSNNRVNTILLPLIGTAARVILPIMAIFVLLRLWPIPPDFEWVFRKLTAISLIVAVSWTLRRAVVLGEQTVLSHQDIRQASNYEGRAIYTRVNLLRKIALAVIAVFAFAAVLMVFDEVRDLGRSILASAGIAGIIIGFAAQKSLGNLLAGLQIALTQPIRLGDQVLVSGEVGTIEEITLTYVVVRVWDLRRLIVPINYFNENTFQNWSRTSVNMLCTVTLRADFSMPVDAFRAYMEQVVKNSKHWDGKAFGVQVTNADHYSMEVRVLASAENSGVSFDLQCEMREKAIDFIHVKYPQCLPKAREEGKPIQTWQTSEEIGPRNRLPDTLPDARPEPPQPVWSPKLAPPAESVPPRK